ncbi:LysR family transcriptional regulator [Sulfidibacter corallicola]|uniref:LysR family transcriptional regulator n=1 Tax=Sulfidibacter corallicola TaxID=2818388 RepID=A0A8A4TR31_SULCO|nr:LysR family transcriptional regulator [Sulfidibacter corallicola]QTD48975.1 LysR family transcriptional regulator [Sulfidibacter corallicola]
MDTKHLQLFVEVVRRGSFAAVARDHALDPSSVSRAITSLEEQMGVRLIQRTTRQLTLTEAGTCFFERVEAVIDELDRAREAAMSVVEGPTGTLRLTASTAFGHHCLVPLLPRFREAFPHLKWDLAFTDRNLNLVEERIDLAIRLAPRIEGHVVAVQLFPTRYRVCAAPEYLKNHPPISEPANLTDHRCLLFPFKPYRNRWVFREETGREIPVAVDGDVVVSNALSLRSCALRGMGPVLLANWLIDEDIRRGDLVALFPEMQVAATEFETAAWLVYPSRTFLPHKVRLTIDFLKDAFARFRR